MKCGDVYFSLLWDSRENYEEWLGSGNGRGEYITDLNLEYLYEEIQRLSGYGEQYDWEKIFLHPCTRVSTVLHRQGIMQRLWEDPSLYGAARDFISSVSGMRKKMGRVCGMNDERKKRLCFLQAAETFFTEMEGLYERTDRERDWKPGLAEGIRRLADCIAGSSAKKERAVLSDCLQKLCRYAPQNLILNKDKTQACHNIVIVPGPPKNILDSYTGRLREAAEFFLGEYDFSIDVYQDMDITCLDQKLMEYTYAQAGETRNEIDIIYEKYRDFDFFPFISLADELVFYLSCIHFRREYEKEGFYFTMPCFGTERTCVKGAYDMLLGVNLFKNGEGCRPVSNDYAFHRGASWFILTGANQGGKTTFIRSIGLIQCLAQTGMFVPAEEAILKAVGHIHTHFSREEESASVGRFEQELRKVHAILEQLEEGDMILLNEPFTSTQRITAVAILKELVLKFHCRGCVGGLVTHFYEIAEILPRECFYSLAAEVVQGGDGRERTFCIVPRDPYCQSYARDIAAKCGATYEQLMEAMGFGEGVADNA